MTLVVVSRPAQAEADPTRLEFRAPAQCPDAGAFRASVRERMRRGRLTDDPRARAYVVVIRRGSEGWIASMHLDDAPSAEPVREVAADDCADAVRAMALVTALAIDAELPESPTGSEGPQGGPAPPPAEAAVDDGEGRPAADSSPASPEKRDREGAGTPGASAERSRRSAPRLELDLRGTSSTPKGPRPLFGGELALGAGGRERDWRVELALVAERGQRQAVELGEARFSFFGGRISGCVFAWRPSRAVRFLPCATLEVGAVLAQGFIEFPETVTDPWVAIAPAIRGEFGARALRGTLQVGPVFPLMVEDQYVFGSTSQPDATLHAVPVLGGLVSVGATWKIE